MEEYLRQAFEDEHDHYYTVGFLHGAMAGLVTAAGLILVAYLLGWI
jgi:hypothetical protein